MQIQVLLFAGLREAAGATSITVSLDGSPTVADLLQAVARSHPNLADRLPPCRVAVDEVFADADTSIPDGAEVAIIPPVSGGHDGPDRIALRSTPLSLDAVVAAVRHQDAGGIATFTGMVRRHSRGKTVVRLEYEAYDGMALRAMGRIADAIEAEVEGSRVAIHHRVGVLSVGDVAVVIAASAPHRAEAFAACRQAIERLKQDVPIWKKEVDADGGEWIGQGP